MKRFATLVVVLAALAWCGAAHAALIAQNVASDGDGAIACLASSTLLPDQAGEYALAIAGPQFWGPGHMVGTLTADTPTDPTIRVLNSVDNDTTFAWTGYQVKVKMGTPDAFTLTNLSQPTGWTAAVTAPVLDGGVYVGTIDYAVGTGSPIAVGGTFDFGYKIAFTGATSYSYCQEMTPVPEPGSMALLAMGALAGLFAVIRRRAA